MRGIYGRPSALPQFSGCTIRSPYVGRLMAPGQPSSDPIGRRPAPATPWWQILLGAAAVAGVGIAVYRATQPKKQKHDRVVKRIAGQLDGDGWFVAADVRGYPRPPTVFGSRTDVHAWHPDGRELLVEVEHEGTLDTSHSRKQFVAFERYKRLSRRRKFEIAVV